MITAVVFRGLYVEGSLFSRVRLTLAKLLQTLYLNGKGSQWTNVVIKGKKKKGEGKTEQRKIVVREALIEMVEDADHCVRMFMAKIVSSLYLDPHRVEGYYQSMLDAPPLLPRNEQEIIFEKVSQMLTKAELLEVRECGKCMSSLCSSVVRALVL